MAAFLRYTRLFYALKGGQVMVRGTLMLMTELLVLGMLLWIYHQTSVRKSLKTLKVMGIMTYLINGESHSCFGLIVTNY